MTPDPDGVSEDFEDQGSRRGLAHVTRVATVFHELPVLPVSRDGCG